MNRYAEPSPKAANYEARHQTTARVCNRGAADTTLRVGIQDDEPGQCPAAGQRDRRRINAFKPGTRQSSFDRDRTF